MALNPQPSPLRQYTFTANTPAVASQVNTELNTLYSVLQGGVGSVHLADNAGILFSQLGVSTATIDTPVWTTTGTAPAIGNGTLTGQHLSWGGLIFGNISFNPGTTTTYGTGTFRFSLPVNPTYGGIMGAWDISQDAGASTRSGAVHLSTASTVELWSSDASFITINGTTPFTWAGGNDSLNLWYMYIKP